MRVSEREKDLFISTLREEVALIDNLPRRGLRGGEEEETLETIHQQRKEREFDFKVSEENQDRIQRMVHEGVQLLNSVARKDITMNNKD